MTLITSINHIYASSDLNQDFEFFCTPLKSFNSFFDEKIKKNAGFTKLALQVTYVVSAFFVYPTFGSLAGIGICLKLTGFDYLKMHNQSQIHDVNNTKSIIKTQKRPEKYSSLTLSINQLQEIKSVILTKKNVDTEYPGMVTAIHAATGRFQKAYLHTLGFIDEDQGAITIQLFTLKV